MNKIYPQVRLGDVCEYYTGRIAAKLLDEKTYISTENMLSEKGGITVSSGLPTIAITPEYKKDNILLSNIRPYFKKIWFATQNGGCSNDVLVLKAKNNYFPKFLYYVLSDDKFFDYSTATSKGTKMPRGDKAAIMQYSVPDIPNEEQRAIAATLSCLDDKIELNNRINTNLESQAQAIFKSWFVDFEPFQGGEFVDSELGKIPKGWKTVTLDDMCSKITDGSHFSPKDSVDGKYPMLSVKDMESYGFNYQSCKMIDANDYEMMISNDCVPLINDILIAKDGSYLKHIFIVNENRQEAILSSIAIFRPDPSIICPELLLCILKYPTVQQTIKDNYVSGSALPRIVLKDFKKLKLVLPPMEEQQKTFSLLSIMYRKIAESQAEINNLVAIRDSLLPRLMSGDIEVEAN